MSENRPIIDLGDVVMYGALGVIAVIMSFVAYGLGHQFFDKGTVITGLSAFGSGVSAVTSLLVVIFFIKQTNIFKVHSDILETQSELMELQYIPRISCPSTPTFDDNSVMVEIENRGAGTATQLELLTHIEFSDSRDYDSPLNGRVVMEYSSDGAGANVLSGHDIQQFKADARLSITGEDGSEYSRSFDNVVSNLASEGVGKIRVSLKVVASGQGSHQSETAVMPEEYFYSDLDRGERFTLEERYRVSLPR